MILTQELWEEYTAAFPSEFSWEELMDAGLTAQACAAANATNWKLQQVLKQNAELLEALQFYACDCQRPDNCCLDDCGIFARDAIAKATGGE